MEHIGTDTLHFSCQHRHSPLALPLGELSPKVTERVLQSGLPSPSSLRSATSPKGRGKGVLMVLFGSRQSPDFFAGMPTYEMGM